MSDTIDGTWLVLVLGAVITLAILYWIIRRAVTAGIRDADAKRTTSSTSSRSGDGLGGYPAWNAKKPADDDLPRRAGSEGDAES